MHYTLKDHQGSLAATVCGNTVERLSYDAWGRRRNPNGFGYGNVSHTFDRGYTLHEHYDHFDLINMNGRLYDPVIGRFMTTDAKAEDYYDISPYAYCINNPVNAFDPDGKNPVFMALLLKGLVGAAVDASAQVSISMINGKSFKEAVGEIDYTSVGAAFVFSAIAAPGASTGAKAATGISKSAKVATGIRNGAKGLAIGVDAAIDINANGEVYSWAGILGENKNVSSIAIDAVALIVPEIVVDNVSSGLSKAIEKDLTSKSAATLPKEVKATMRHTKDVIDNKRIPGEINNFVDFSAGLISGQAKKVIDPPNAKSTSSYRPPMILAPQKNDKAEQSIYQKMIYSK